MRDTRHINMLTTLSCIYQCNRRVNAHECQRAATSDMHEEHNSRHNYIRHEEHRVIRCLNDEKESNGVTI